MTGTSFLTCIYSISRNLSWRLPEFAPALGAYSPRMCSSLSVPGPEIPLSWTFPSDPRLAWRPKWSRNKRRASLAGLSRLAFAFPPPPLLPLASSRPPRPGRTRLLGAQMIYCAAAAAAAACYVPLDQRLCRSRSCALQDRITLFRTLRGSLSIPSWPPVVSLVFLGILTDVIFFLYTFIPLDVRVSYCRLARSSFAGVPRPTVSPSRIARKTRIRRRRDRERAGILFLFWIKANSRKVLSYDTSSRCC